MSELFEFISKEYSFREINFRGIQLLGVSQEHNFHRPVSRPLAVYNTILIISIPPAW
jgi:hypothetical protein